METEQQQREQAKKVKWPSKNYITFELWNSWESKMGVDQYYTWMMSFFCCFNLRRKSVS